MSSKQSTIDFLVKQMSRSGEIRAKKMFGEYGIYCDEKIVALVCDDNLYVKPTLKGEMFLGVVEEGMPYPGAKPYFLISPERWNNGEWLSCLIKITADQLPMPKPRKKK